MRRPFPHIAPRTALYLPEWTPAEGKHRLEDINNGYSGTGAVSTSCTFGVSGITGDNGSNGRGVVPSPIHLPAGQRIEQIVSSIGNALRQYDGTGTLVDQDLLFQPHTQAFVDQLNGHDIRGLKNLWSQQLSALVRQREQEIGKPIHKGAPLHNTGLLHFADGDFDSALAYMAEAGREDERAGIRQWHQVVLGDHPLTKQVLIEPLEKGLFQNWASDYRRITGCNLDSVELTKLLASMADRRTDAIEAVTALHRIARSLAVPENGGSAMVRSRALADLLHLVESFLRQFQTVNGQLAKHLQELLRHKPIANRGYNDFQMDFNVWCSRSSNDKESATAMNWVTSEAGVRIRSAASHAYAAGIVAFFCHKLRNCLLHVNEENLSFFQNASECATAAGWVLAMLRICSFQKSGVFAVLP